MESIILFSAYTGKEYDLDDLTRKLSDFILIIAFQITNAE